MVSKERRMNSAVECLEEAARIADGVSSKARQSLLRAKRRQANSELLNAVGYQGDPDFEVCELTTIAETAEAIAAEIRNMAILAGAYTHPPLPSKTAPA
jgi:hypothetical protein